MAACSPCQSACINCQTHWCWGSSLRIARDVDFHKHMIRWTKWSRRRAGDICEKVNHHRVQRGRICHWEKSTLESSQIESFPWIHRTPLLKCHGWWERYQHKAKLHGDNWNLHIWGRDSWDEWWKLVHVMLLSWWESAEFQNEMIENGTRDFVEHLNPCSLEKKGTLGGSADLIGRDDAKCQKKLFNYW